MLLSWDSARDIQPGQWRWPHVHPLKEWACKGTGRIIVDTDFLDRFERLRAAYGRPIVINSGYRSPEHNMRVSDSGRTGPHTTARAFDALVYGTHAQELLLLALAHGFTGIGVAQESGRVHASRFLHLDDLPNSHTHPRPWVWSY